MKRKLSGNNCSCCCRLKEKLEYLWQHTMGAILKINDITPDGDGKFTIEAGSNVQITDVPNGLRIDTTGGISYYSAGDSYIDVDNNDLEISLVTPGQSGGVALYDDLATKVSGSGTIGDDFHPVKVVGGQATAISNNVISWNNLAYEAVIAGLIRTNQTIPSATMQIDKYQNTRIDTGSGSNSQTLQFRTTYDNAGVRVGNLFYLLYDDGRIALYSETINRDGTYSYTKLAGQV